MMGSFSHLTPDIWRNFRIEVGQIMDVIHAGLAAVVVAQDRINRCPKLNRLSARGNALTTIAPEIGLLSSLTSLDLADNALAELPPELGNLTVSRLEVDGNPLPEDYPEDTEELLEYLRQQAVILTDV